MTITSKSELEAMQHIGGIVGRTLKAIVPKVRAGVTTRELDERVAEELDRCGARPAPKMVYGFPGSLCISVNDEVVHGIPRERVLRGGDVVTVDVTAEKDGFMADAARTVVVPVASKLKKRLAACSRVAFSAAMKAARAGNRVHDIGSAIEDTAARYGFIPVRDCAGHGIGREIHEEPSVPSVYDASLTEELVPGLVLAVEPIVSAGCSVTRVADDGWTVLTVDGSLAAHYENTVVITEGAPLVLTAA